MSTIAKVIKCKAAVAWAPNQPLAIKEIEVQPPKENEVRIKMVSTGICRTDDHAIHGDFAGLNFPVILGHEGAGIIESVGKGVTGLNPGDKVVPLCLPQCGKCSSCLNPQSNFCFKSHFYESQNVMPDKTSRFSCKGKVVYHFLWTSTFSEYIVIPADAVAKIDDEAPMERACLFGCGFPTGYGAAVNTAKVQSGTTCAVFGLGGIGLSAIIGCKVSGASKIIAIDINSSKFEKAKLFGATDCINPNDYNKPIQEVIMEMTGHGVHYSFECIGNTDVMKAALECTHSGYGTSVVVGEAPPNTKITFDPLLLLTGRTWKGSLIGGFKSMDSIPQLVSDYMSGMIDVDGLVTHTLPFTQINEGFQLLRSGKSAECAEGQITGCTGTGRTALSQSVQCCPATRPPPCPLRMYSERNPKVMMLELTRQPENVQQDFSGDNIHTMSTAGKVIKCKAAVAWAPNQPLAIEEIEVQPPKAQEVRIKMVSTGICRTDDHALRGHMGGVNFPVILGHEGAGIIESVGKGVTGLKPGDKVIPLCLPQCGKCSSCLNPQSNYCFKSHFTEPQTALLDKTSRFSCKGKVVDHFVWTSTFSEYIVMPAGAVAKIDDRVLMEKACLFGCCFPTGYGAAVNSAKVKPGTTCAVFGLGAIGLSVIIGCKVSGASRIIAIDLNSSKFEKAKLFGATDCINPKDYSKPIQEVVKEMTGDGVHYSFECVGNTDVMIAALECTHQGYGTSVVVGVASEGSTITFDPLLLLTGRVWKGSVYGGYKSMDSVPKLVSDYVAGKFNLHGLVTHTLPFTQINEGFQLLRDGKSIRTVLLY
ncbi:uncharacterized protein ACMZJ9_022920 [Mantella aurantiaca]